MVSNKQNKRIGFILITIAFICGGILLYRQLGGYMITPEIVYPLVLLVWFSGGVWAAFRSNSGQFMRIALGWVMVFTAIFFAYNFYQDYKNHRIAQQTEGQMPDFVMQKKGSHFYTDAYVNNVRVSFMLDSGASMVVLTKQAAQRVGIDVDKINDRVLLSTANGEKLEKVTYVDEIRLGDIIATNIRVAISEEGLDENLLGQNFMSEVSKKVEVGNELRLWK
ncbi:MAG: TIGR02281 family clan AA aspartic protease [Alphaproteobacteria bacterium]